MSKRFIDTALWEKAWFRKLSPSHKCAWNYILSRCDAVGVWDYDFEAAEFYIGEAVDWEEFRKACNGNIVLLDNGKWWVLDFCRFQYGELSDNCPPHRNYIKLLLSHGLLERVLKGYRKGIETPQEKEKEKEKEILSSSQDINASLHIICTEPEIPSTVPNVAPPPVEAKPRKTRPTLTPIDFDWEVQQWDGISDDQVSTWSEVYPALNIERELGKAKEWLLANPTKRKKNYRRFLVGWFTRSQERGGERSFKR